MQHSLEEIEEISSLQLDRITFDRLVLEDEVRARIGHEALLKEIREDLEGIWDVAWKANLEDQTCLRAKKGRQELYYANVELMNKLNRIHFSIVRIARGIAMSNPNGKSGSIVLHRFFSAAHHRARCILNSTQLAEPATLQHS